MLKIEEESILLDLLGELEMNIINKSNVENLVDDLRSVESLNQDIKKYVVDELDIILEYGYLLSVSGVKNEICYILDCNEYEEVA